MRTVLPVIVAAYEAAANRLEHASGTAGFRVAGEQATTSGTTAALGRAVPSLVFTACRNAKDQRRAVRPFLHHADAGRWTATDTPKH